MRTRQGLENRPKSYEHLNAAYGLCPRELRAPAEVEDDTETARNEGEFALVLRYLPKASAKVRTARGFTSAY